MYLVREKREGREQAWLQRSEGNFLAKVKRQGGALLLLWLHPVLWVAGLQASRWFSGLQLP